MNGLLVACSTFALYAGAGVSESGWNHPSWQHENPIGIVGLEYNYSWTTRLGLRGVIEHNSELFEKDHPGLNVLEGHILFKFK